MIKKIIVGALTVFGFFIVLASFLFVRGCQNGEISFSIKPNTVNKGWFFYPEGTGLVDKDFEYVGEIITFGPLVEKADKKNILKIFKKGQNEHLLNDTFCLNVQVDTIDLFWNTHDSLSITFFEIGVPFDENDVRDTPYNQELLKSGGKKVATVEYKLKAGPKSDSSFVRTGFEIFADDCKCEVK